MTLGGGWSRWSVNEFDAFRDIPLDSIIMAIPTVSAATNSGVGCLINWNTWNGNNFIEFYTPTSQDVFFNLFVIWAV